MEIKKKIPFIVNLVLLNRKEGLCLNVDNFRGMSLFILNFRYRPNLPLQSLFGIFLLLQIFFKNKFALSLAIS
jgi:hypothetical protein